MNVPVDVPGDDQAAKRPRMLSMWPESWEEIAEVDKLHRFDKVKALHKDLAVRERAFADTNSLEHLVRASSVGNFQMAHLVSQWEKTQANAVQLLRQQLESLDLQRQEAQRKYEEIVESQWNDSLTENATFPSELEIGESSCPMCEDDHLHSGASSSNLSSMGSLGLAVPDDTENSVDYWKERSKKMGLLLTASLQREQALLIQLKEKSKQNASSVPLEDLRESLTRMDNFLHFILQKAPIVIGHQDAELRHKFIYNPFPGLTREDFIGKIDTEINNGPGVEECMEFKREVLRRGKPMQKEFDMYSDLFGHKTLLLTVEPVVCKSGESLGINYLALDITEEAERREKFVVLREEAAVQKTLETELQRSIVVTEEAMRAKQMLATMSHEIRSPLSGVVSMAQVLGTTKLDGEQRAMVEIMNSSGEHVLELINDILDLSKAESGAMKLEAKKFRPRLVVKRVLQLAMASVHNKKLSLKPDVAKDVPEEVVGDVLRIRQVLTNLVSNAVKFTPKGEVTITVRVASPPPGTQDSGSVAPPPGAEEAGRVASPPPGAKEVGPVASPPSGAKDAGRVASPPPGAKDSGSIQVSGDSKVAVAPSRGSVTEPGTTTQRVQDSANESANWAGAPDYLRSSSSISSASTLDSVSSTVSNASVASTKKVDDAKSEDESESAAAFAGVVWDLSPKSFELTDEVWLHCEVRDTGIGIPEAALPSLFDEYTQASSTTARKYGGTGLGLAICKQLVGIMGGKLEVKSEQNVGSSFSFTIPLWAVKPAPIPVSVKDNRSQTLGTVPERRSEQEAKAKGVDGKLKQMLRDSKRSWINALGESALFGRIKSSVEILSPQVLAEDKESGSNSVDDKSGPLEEVPTLAGKSGCPAAPNGTSKKGPPHLKVGTAQTPITAVRPPQAGSRRIPRILLAEDNNVNVVVAQSMMKRLGHTLEVVSNGAEAVEALKRSNYDLVLMDVSMPVMDGLEATRLIRQFEETADPESTREQPVSDKNAVAVPVTPSDGTLPVPVLASQPSVTSETEELLLTRRTPIIALTANAMAENVTECYHSGMDSFIAKPVTFDKLEQALKQYIPWSAHRRIQSH